MKKVKNLFKNSKTKFILGLILGIILTGGGVYAATIGNSKDVFYDNATSNLSSTNVQDSNGIDYYMTSDTLEVAELVEIARSVSVLPVSK